MAEYYPLLARAVAALPNASRDARLAIYERARKALMAQLRSIEPPVSEEHLDAEGKALDDAIARLESELAAESQSEPTRSAPAFDASPRAGASPPLSSAPPRPDIRPLQPKSPAPTPSGSPVGPTKTIMPARSVSAPPPAASQGAARPASMAKAPFAPVRPSAAPPTGFGQPSASAQGVGGGFGQGSAAPTRSSAAARADLKDRIGALFNSKQEHPPLPDEAAPRSISTSQPALTGEESASPTMKAAGARGDLSRPAAPIRPQTRVGAPRQMLIWLPLVLLIGAGIGLAAWQLRVPQEEFAKARPGQEARQGSAKINERVGGAQQATEAQQAQTTPAPATQPPRTSAQPQQQGAQTSSAPQPQPAGAAAPQRAAMLVQAAVNDQQNVETHVGSASWTLEESRRPGSAGLPALRADLDLPSIGLRIAFLIEKNNDATLRASHMLTVRFLPQEGSRLPPVAEIGSPQMRNETTPSVEPLAGAQAKITEQIYIVALSAEPALVARNLELIRTRGWFDMPMRLADGRIAKVTLEKGSVGEKLLAQAMDVWQKQ